MAWLEKNCPSERDTLRSMQITVTAGVDDHNYVLGKQNDTLASSGKLGGAEFTNTG